MTTAIIVIVLLMVGCTGLACAVFKVKAEKERLNLELMDLRLDNIKLHLYLLEQQRPYDPQAGKKGYRTDEAQNAFNEVRKEVAKEILKAPMTTESVLHIARESYIKGFQRARK